ncbi:MAG: hypothetical protein RL591_383 [Planctomycetota bacterium]
MQRLCDCCSNPATVHETLVENGVKTEVHLCAEHAVERGLIVPGPHGPALVVAKLLQGQLSAQQPARRAVKTCPTCGSTMQSIREVGLAGCPLCYRHFEEELGALINRAQGGATVHVGRHPAHAAELVDRAALRNKLARELREAVSREEYERAAKIRDRLQALGGQASDAFAESDACGAEEGGTSP